MVGIVDALGKTVERGFFRNLDSGRQETFLFNPEGFTESYEARYARLAAPGMSHERMQYTGNRNARIPLSLYFDQLMINERRGSNEPPRVANRVSASDVPTVNDVEKWRRFILSLVYPRRGQQLRSASPPPVLFVWPTIISMKVRITSARFRHVLFKVGTPSPRIMVAEIALEEEPERRMYSDDMLTFGTVRPWASQNRPRRR